MNPQNGGNKRGADPPLYIQAPEYSNTGNFGNDEESDLEAKRHGTDVMYNVERSDRPVYLEVESTGGNRTISRRLHRSRKSTQNLVNMLPSNNPDAYAIVSQLVREGRNIDDEEISALVAGEAHPEFTATTMRSTTIRRKKTMAHRKSSARLYVDEQRGEAEDNIDAIYESQKMLENIRAIPQLSIQDKVELVRQEKQVLEETRRTVSRYQLAWGDFFIRVRRMGSRSIEWLRDIGLWKRNIKKIEGKHGNTVAAYFYFLRWSLFMNIVIAIFWASFLMIPFGLEHGFDHTQALVPAMPDSFTARENIIGLFTGGGALNGSGYFIGSYMIPSSTVSKYDFPMAYLIVALLYIVFVFATILYGLHGAVYQNSAFDVDDGQQPFSELVFGGYDHTLSDPSSITIKQAGIARLLKEVLGEQESWEEYKKKSKTRLYTRRIIINLIILVILAVALYLVQLAVVQYSEEDNLKRLVPAILLAIFNIVLPFGFELLARAEEWRTPLFVIQITVFRSIILRIAGLYVFFYTHFLRRVKFMCWETYMGQQAYNLFIVTFFFELLTSLAVDPLKKSLHENFPGIRPYMQTARFQTIKNMLELIYSQAIVWFGVFFCPVLAVLAIFKTIILFYCKEFSTSVFCAPPIKAFKLNRSFHSLIYSMHLFSLICILFPLGYTIVQLPTSGAYMDQTSQERWLTGSMNSSIPCSVNENSAYCVTCFETSYIPTATVCYKGSADVLGMNVTMAEFCSNCQTGCGPFRNQESMYDTVTKQFHTWPTLLQTIIQYMGTLAFAAMCLIVVSMWLFYERARSQARLKRVIKTQIERDMERMDKRWILQTYSITLDQINGAPKSPALRK